MALAGSNVRVQTHGVNKDEDGWMKSSGGKMMLYNEMAKF